MDRRTVNFIKPMEKPHIYRFAGLWYVTHSLSWHPDAPAHNHAALVYVNHKNASLQSCPTTAKTTDRTK